MSIKLYCKNKLNSKQLSTIEKIVKNGGIIIFPTDTVYGIGTYFSNKKGIEKIYKIKKRDKSKKIAYLIGYKKDIKKFVKKINFPAKLLMKKFWPGPLTLILKEKNSTIGVRMPANIISLQILRRVGPLATTSANLSGEKSPATFQEISQELLRKVDLVIDAGQVEGVPSTVIEVGQQIKIIREGKIKLKLIEKILHA